MSKRQACVGLKTPPSRCCNCRVAPAQHPSAKKHAAACLHQVEQESLCDCSTNASRYSFQAWGNPLPACTSLKEPGNLQLLCQAGSP